MLYLLQYTVYRKTPYSWSGSTQARDLLTQRTLETRTTQSESTWTLLQVRSQAHAQQQDASCLCASTIRRGLSTLQYFILNLINSHQIPGMRFVLNEPVEPEVMYSSDDQEDLWIGMRRSPLDLYHNRVIYQRLSRYWWSWKSLFMYFLLFEDKLIIFILHI